jgi:hypothetical protein
MRESRLRSSEVPPKCVQLVGVVDAARGALHLAPPLFHQVARHARHLRVRGALEQPVHRAADHGRLQVRAADDQAAQHAQRVEQLRRRRVLGLQHFVGVRVLGVMVRCFYLSLLDDHLPVEENEPSINCYINKVDLKNLV